MKKKLALLMAAIMTVAMVPMTAFAKTAPVDVDEISTVAGEDHMFTSRIELVKKEETPALPKDTTFEVTVVRS